jgi:hypothetical protein
VKDILCPQFLHFSCKNSFWGCCAVDTIGFDRNDDSSADLEELVGIKTDDTGLIWLRYVGKDAVYHGDKHSIPIEGGMVSMGIIMGQN